MAKTVFKDTINKHDRNIDQDFNKVNEKVKTLEVEATKQKSVVEVKSLNRKTMKSNVVHVYKESGIDKAAIKIGNKVYNLNLTEII